MSNEIPLFFVPNYKKEDHENVYRSIADEFSYPIPPPDRRIYSITFTHTHSISRGTKEIWTAKVGGKLSGIKYRIRDNSQQELLHDMALVLAILPNYEGTNSFTIFTDSGFGSSSSLFANPMRDAEASNVVYFRTESS
jgi:hypothetical protein